VTIHKDTVTVECKPDRGSRRDPGRTRATVGISRGHRVVAYGSGSLRHLALHTSSRLRGRYVLSIDVKGYRPLRLNIRLK
jgi:hypothetical protein